MSDPIRLAIVSEGPTDRIVIEAIVAALVPSRDFVVTQLQPESTESFGQRGGGWTGVYRWCRQAVAQGRGAIASNVLFDFHDLLVIHLDADVAGKTYGSGNIAETVHDLPCERPCPPCSATTDALRRVILRWIASPNWPDRVVPCTPSRNTETWVLVALYPDDPASIHPDVECHDDASVRLAAKPAGQRLVRYRPGEIRPKKNVSRYADRKADMIASWAGVRGACAEAERFSTDLMTAIANVATDH